MKRNSRLSLALHTLVHMAGDPDRVRTSADIAVHVGTNPVVVRRVLGQLRETGLLTSEKGHSGGWRLARTPQEITLADVYAGLDEHLVASSADDEPLDCAVEHTLYKRISKLMEDIEQSLVDKLSATTIAEVSDAADRAQRRNRFQNTG